MNKIYKIETSFIAIIIFMLLTNISLANENVPIPPKRPNILNVSPAYIEELKNRYKLKQEKKSIVLDESEKKTEEDQQDIEKEIIEIAIPTDLANILEESSRPSDHKKTVLSDIYIPIPSQKPFLTDIEPASGEKIRNKKPNLETTLISFTLKPQQIELDKNLEQFLQTHAIKLFSEDTSLKMEIYAYATPIEGEKHSEVRISLARALKIRSFLISKQIAPHRLKLSPMGVKGNEDKIDRVDLLFIKAAK